MTRQEELLGGMQHIISALLASVLYIHGIQTEKQLKGETEDLCRIAFKKLLEFQRDKGVVLKVNREIVNPYEHGWMPIEGEAYNRAIKDNNLVAVEPLIGEK